MFGDYGVGKKFVYLANLCTCRCTIHIIFYKKSLKHQGMTLFPELLTFSLTIIVNTSQKYSYLNKCSIEIMQFEILSDEMIFHGAALTQSSTFFRNTTLFASIKGIREYDRRLNFTMRVFV